MRAERNEVLDQGSLIARYQKEVAALRAHLERVGGAAPGMHDPMHPEVTRMPTLQMRVIPMHVDNSSLAEPPAVS